MATINEIVSAFGGNLLPDSETHRHRFEVKSESSDSLYIVSQKNSTGEWQCSCRGWIMKRPGKERSCKHLSAMLPALHVIGSMVAFSNSTPTVKPAPALALPKAKPARKKPAPVVKKSPAKKTKKKAAKKAGTKKKKKS